MNIAKIVRTGAKVVVAGAAAVTVWKAYKEVDAILEEEAPIEEKVIDVAIAVAPVFVLGFGLAAYKDASYWKRRYEFIGTLMDDNAEALSKGMGMTISEIVEKYDLPFFFTYKRGW